MDTLTHVEEDEVLRENDSATDEETFWDCPTELEEIAETDMPEKDKQEIKVRPKSESVWDNQHINDTIKTVPKLSKENKKVNKLRRDFLTKIILFSIFLGRCATAKEIEGLPVRNNIQKGNLPDKYFIEQSNKDII